MKDRSCQATALGYDDIPQELQPILLLFGWPVLIHPNLHGQFIQLIEPLFKESIQGEQEVLLDAWLGKEALD